MARPAVVLLSGGLDSATTLAIGSILTFFAIVIGAAGTMKYQYWRITQEA